MIGKILLSQCGARANARSSTVTRRLRLLYTEFFIVACTRQASFSLQSPARSPLLHCERFVINYSTSRRGNRAFLFYRLPFREKLVKIRSIFAVSFSLSSISVLLHFLHLSIYVLSSSVFLFFPLVAKNLVAAIHCCDERETNDGEWIVKLKKYNNEKSR